MLALWLAFGAGLAVLTTRVVDWYVMTDELFYERLAMSIARSHSPLPRIHGELLMLGFDVSERTVSRYLPRGRPKPDASQRWLVFLRNHRDAIAAMDFFTVPTVTFDVLYVWFAIDHGRYCRRLSIRRPLTA